MWETFCKKTEIKISHEVNLFYFKRKDLFKHLFYRLHTLENVLTCDDCGKIFAESYSLRKHRETHEKGLRNDQVEYFDS